MGVSLRKQSLKDGRQSLYLDIYNKGKRYTVFLDIKLEKANSPDARQRNNEKIKLAESIKAKKELDIQNRVHGFRSAEGESILLLEYIKQLTDKRFKETSKANGDNWFGAFKHLTKFLKGKKVLLGEVDEQLLEAFKVYLLGALSQNSAVSYFNKLKAALRQAFERRLINDNPAARVRGIKYIESKREYLTEEEMIKLAKTECRYPILKKAFLFSVLTGLRWSDINKLTWSEVRDMGIHFRQKKTDGVEYLPINKEAMGILDELSKGNPVDRVFIGLKYSSYHNVAIMQWMLSAGITKKITFHCARHTNAVLLLSSGVDIYTVSKLLGHRELKTTQIYAKIVDKQKREAVDKLPSILLDLNIGR
ncbi:MAG: site-specific integrase [Bacteroidetes bacterium]|nr:site-specific integrase [Bacteroidota bacterium]